MDYCTFRRLENLEAEINRLKQISGVKTVDMVPAGPDGNVQINAFSLVGGKVPNDKLNTGTGTGEIPVMGGQGLPNEILYTGADGLVHSRPENMSGKWLGVFETSADLPGTANIGDTADVSDGTFWGFSGTWEQRPLPIVDLTDYELVNNKVGTLDTSVDHYPSCKAVSDAIAAGSGGGTEIAMYSCRVEKTTNPPARCYFNVITPGPVPTATNSIAGVFAVLNAGKYTSSAKKCVASGTIVDPLTGGVIPCIGIYVTSGYIGIGTIPGQGNESLITGGNATLLSGGCTRVL